MWSHLLCWEADCPEHGHYHLSMGLKSFMADIVFMFTTFNMTFCFAYREDQINDADDSIGKSLLKLFCGYFLGKL